MPSCLCKTGCKAGPYVGLVMDGIGVARRNTELPV